MASCSEQSSKTTTADTTASTAEKVPEGHLLPIGSHRKPEGAVEVLQEFPEPRVFYEKYVIPGKPVLFKGLAKRMPTFLDWTDEKMRYCHIKEPDYFLVELPEGDHQVILFVLMSCMI